MPKQPNCGFYPRIIIMLPSGGIECDLATRSLVFVFNSRLLVGLRMKLYQVVII